MKPDPSKSCGPYKPLSGEELSERTKEAAEWSEKVDSLGSGAAQRSLAEAYPGRELLQHARTGDLPGLYLFLYHPLAAAVPLRSYSPDTPGESMT